MGQEQTPRLVSGLLGSNVGGGWERTLLDRGGLLEATGGSRDGGVGYFWFVGHLCVGV